MQVGAGLRARPHRPRTCDGYLTPFAGLPTTHHSPFASGTVATANIPGGHSRHPSEPQQTSLGTVADTPCSRSRHPSQPQQSSPGGPQQSSLGAVADIPGGDELYLTAGERSVTRGRHTSTSRPRRGRTASGREMESGRHYPLSIIHCPLSIIPCP